MDVITKKGDVPKDSDSQKRDSKDDNLDDFNEYLRKCALGVLAPFTTQDDGEHQKDEEQSAESSE